MGGGWTNKIRQCWKRFKGRCTRRPVVRDSDGSPVHHLNEELAQKSHYNHAMGTAGEAILATPNTVADFGLDNFELLGVIGRGSFAKVLLVSLQNNKDLYAMKVIKKELLTDEDDVYRVRAEKHVFETASNHPFLVGLHSCFQTPERLFFVIDYITGGDLLFHMQRQRKLPEDHARFYASEIVLALHFLHEKGIIYRDLKLDNVLLDSDGHIKLTDYGMCKEGILKGERTSTFCGTPNYIAPEILRGEDYGFSVDWWALGVLMFEMMTGRSPFDIVGMTDSPDQNTKDYLFQVILEKVIRIPRSLSVKASSVLRGFLNKIPEWRLGCHPTSGFQDILEHGYFRSIEWDLLQARQVIPPYKPSMTDEYGLENFDPQFVEEPVQLTPSSPRTIAEIDQAEFEGFEYINPLLMTSVDVVADTRRPVVGGSGLDNFELLGVIGRGGYGKVLLVSLQNNKKLYAMKVIKKESITDEEDVDQVQTEKHVFETASNRPFLVGLHSCFQTPERLFFVIDYIAGGDLLFHVQRQRKLPEDHACFYASEIVLALKFLHENGIIHRDLKLDNVLLDIEGHIKLADYGICKEGILQGERTSTFCGTPKYMAPEILCGEDYGFSVDWWALGLLMFEMMTGCSPFDIVGMTDSPDEDKKDYLFQVILEEVIRIPRSLSVKASSVLRGFLNKIPEWRLGCHPTTGFQDILDHDYFRSIEWDLLKARQVIPPYKPSMTDEYGLENFDPQFVKEPVQLTPSSPWTIAEVDQAEFEGFEYINPLLMTSADMD